LLIAIESHILIPPRRQGKKTSSPTENIPPRHPKKASLPTKEAFMIEKIFSVEEAEKLIPELEKIVESVMENKKNAMAIGEELVELQNQIRAGEFATNPADILNKQTELEFLVRIINEGIEAIESMGCQPKDLDVGLVDFPTYIEGEEVLLCWKYGEKAIDYYHGLYDGFAGRKPLQKS
jgi:hypothetical protein